MKKLGIFLLIICAFTFASARNAVFVSLTGDVYVKHKDTTDFEPARSGSRTKSGDIIKTGTGGKAQLVFTNKINIWADSSTEFEILKSRSRVTAVKILSGRVKFKTGYLKRRNILKVRTRNSLFSADNASFVLEQNSPVVLNVIFGGVKYLGKNGKSSKLITQGLSFRTDTETNSSALKILTQAQQTDATSDWSPQTIPSRKVRLLKKAFRNRMKLRNFALDTDKMETMVAHLTNRLKESDIEAGRTLRDIHGNLVRVEQRLLRPYANTIQFVNIVKRPDYKNTVGNFSYNGGDVSNRLDVFQMRTEFNKNLPQNLNNWYGFFTGNDIIAKRASLTMSSHTNSDNAYIMGFLAHNRRYDISTGVINPALENKLDTGENFYFGTVSRGDYNKFAGFQVDIVNGLSSDGTVKDLSSNILNGLAWAQSPDASGGWNELNPSAMDLRVSLQTSGDDVLYQYKVHPYCVGGDCGTAQNKVWFAQEYYIIANNGAVVNIKDIAGAGVGFSRLLDNIAGQAIFYVKNDTGVFDWYQISDTDTDLQIGTGFTNPNMQNIDLVFIPDAPYQAVEKTLSLINTLNNE